MHWKCLKNSNAYYRRQADQKSDSETDSDMLGLIRIIKFEVNKTLLSTRLYSPSASEATILWRFTNISIIIIIIIIIIKITIHIEKCLYKRSNFCR